ncbi:MAG: MFS transporter [Gluconacetobacter diazotrophicus]|nr:MFS transporter [Gluconacetobacter diazotrophicus]
MAALRRNPFTDALAGFNYRVWVAGAFVSNVGTWVQRTAQDWLVLTGLTHGRASAVGLVMALQFGPQLVLLPWTGLAADRLDRRRLLMGTQAAMGLLSLGLGILVAARVAQLWEVDGFALLFGIAAAFDAPVRQVFVSELVGDERLPGAVALNSFSFNAGRMVGPAAAGLLIGAVGAGWAFLFNGLSFGGVLLSLCSLRRGELHPQARAQRGPGSLLDGLRTVRARPDLTAMLLMLFLLGTFGLNFAIFTSTMAANVFHTGARGFGMLSSVMAAGTMAGALLGGVVGGGGRTGGAPAWGRLAVVTAAFGLAGVSAALSQGYWWFAGSLVVLGAASLVFITVTNSAMQLGVEPVLRGRVMALRLAVLVGGTPVGAPIVAAVADGLGPRAALGVGAASGFAAAAVAWRMRSWERFRSPRPELARRVDGGV